MGKSGEYLDKWLDAISCSRTDNVFLTNIIKCGTPNNRDPFPNECEACTTYLNRQIELLQPKVIFGLGQITAQLLTGQKEEIVNLRSTKYKYNSIPLIISYHPEDVLNNLDLRKDVWLDLKLLKEML